MVVCSRAPGLGNERSLNLRKEPGLFTPFIGARRGTFTRNCQSRLPPPLTPSPFPADKGPVRSSVTSLVTFTYEASRSMELSITELTIERTQDPVERALSSTPPSRQLLSVQVGKGQ